MIEFAPPFMGNAPPNSVRFFAFTLFKKDSALLILRKFAFEGAAVFMRLLCKINIPPAYAKKGHSWIYLQSSNALYISLEKCPFLLCHDLKFLVCLVNALAMSHFSVPVDDSLACFRVPSGFIVSQTKPERSSLNLNYSLLFALSRKRQYLINILKAFFGGFVCNPQCSFKRYVFY